MHLFKFIRNSGIKCLFGILMLLLYLLLIREILEIKKLIILNKSFEKSNNNQNKSKNDSGNIASETNSKLKPKTEYELLRRRIRSNTLELFNYIKFSLNETKNKYKKNDGGKDIDNVISMSREHINAIISDMDQMKEYDGYEKWRQDKARDLSQLVQRRIAYLQNPKDCNKAKKLVCGITNWYCRGFSCQLNHMATCFILAYALERTLFIYSAGWSYTNVGWEKVFIPLSETCTAYNRSALVSLADGNKDSEIVEHSYYSNDNRLQKFDKFKPLTIPDDLASDLIRLHGEPSAWWISQFSSYLFRFQPELQKIVGETIQKLNFKKPIVGVHIRRTDKVSTNEASFYGLDEYMEHVKDYYERLEMTEKVDVRRVFIASDDPNVIEEARSKYPNFEIIGDANIAKKAAESTRYSLSSLYEAITDIHLLSLTDYLVCTLSSNLCRTAFELMQSKHADASHRIKSLDAIFCHNEIVDNYKAILPHRANNKNETSLNIGDVITTIWEPKMGWNGYLKGQNTMNEQSGYFPSFKVDKIHRTASFPQYLNVN